VAGDRGRTILTEVNSTSLADELELLERQGWDALSGQNGAAFYEAVMANEGLMVFPGLVMDKPASLDAIRAAGPWLNFELTDVRVARVAEAGLISYRAVGQRADRPPYQAVMSSVYVRQGGRWRLLLHQQSPES
jgi:hypothetical protein